MIETTYVVTKPGVGQGFVARIVEEDYLKLSGERHMVRTVGRLVTRDVRGMYKGLRGPLLDATITHLTSSPVIVMKLTGDDAIAKTLGRRGTDVNPFKCESGTWRLRSSGAFGTTCITLPGGSKYWFNFVHTPRNAEEVRECDYLFKRFFQ